MTTINYFSVVTLLLLLAFTVNLSLKISNLSSDLKNIKALIERLLIESENDHVGAGLEKRLRNLQKTKFSVNMSSNINKG